MESTLNLLFACALALAVAALSVARYNSWKTAHPIYFVLLLLMLAYAGTAFGQCVPWAQEAWGNAWLQQMIFYDAFGPEGVPFSGTHVMFLFVISISLVTTIFMANWFIAVASRIKLLGPIGRLFSAMAPLAVPIIALFFFSLTGAHLRAANIDITVFGEEAAATIGDGITNMAAATSDVADQVAESPNQDPWVPEGVDKNIERAEKKAEEARLKELDKQEKELQKRLLEKDPDNN